MCLSPTVRANASLTVAALFSGSNVGILTRRLLGQSRLLGESFRELLGFILTPFPCKVLGEMIVRLRESRIKTNRLLELGNRPVVFFKPQVNLGNRGVGCGIAWRKGQCGLVQSKCLVNLAIAEKHLAETVIVIGFVGSNIDCPAIGAYCL